MKQLRLPLIALAVAILALVLSLSSCRSRKYMTYGELATLKACGKAESKTVVLYQVTVFFVDSNEVWVPRTDGRYSKNEVLSEFLKVREGRDSSAYPSYNFKIR